MNRISQSLFIVYCFLSMGTAIASNVTVGNLYTSVMTFNSVYFDPVQPKSGGFLTFPNQANAKIMNATNGQEFLLAPAETTIQVTLPSSLDEWNKLGGDDGNSMVWVLSVAQPCVNSSIIVGIDNPNPIFNLTQNGNLLTLTFLSINSEEPVLVLRLSNECKGLLSVGGTAYLWQYPRVTHYGPATTSLLLAYMTSPYLAYNPLLIILLFITGVLLFNFCRLRIEEE